MNALYINHDYARVICTRHITPRVRSLRACQTILKSGKAGLLPDEALYTHIIITCHQLILFLGLDYCDGMLRNAQVSPDENYMLINHKACGGKAIKIDELTNIRKSILSQMLLTAKHIRYAGYTGIPEHLKNLYLDRGGVDYLLLLLKQNFYEETGLEFPSDTHSDAIPGHHQIR